MKSIKIRLSYHDESDKNVYTIDHMFIVEDLKHSSTYANDIIVGTFAGTMLYNLAQQPELEFLRK
jgi:Pyruvate/2-oxoacid:ferredoxin oxidoreductase gamma subunit